MKILWLFYWLNFIVQVNKFVYPKFDITLYLWYYIYGEKPQITDSLGY